MRGLERFAGGRQQLATRAGLEVDVPDLAFVGGAVAHDDHVLVVG